IIHDLQGPSNSITCAEVSGLLSIGEAYRNIARGKADVMVAGGGESKMNAMEMVRHTLMGRTSTHYNDRPQEACRPFDADADGVVLGEGAGLIILEEYERARERGADIYAEITGFGSSSNMSDDFINPESDGAGISIALEKALTEAKLTKDDIQLLIPHGEAIAGHDTTESVAIGKVFAGRDGELPILATKSRIGNCGAGGSGIDLATAALAMKEGKIPPNLNCPNPIQADGLDFGGSSGRQAELKNVINCCYTYGGQTAAMVISKINDK
ncbi:MAG: hypothetical protein GY869_12850, partial [Planctomycetes bacterium]|nr:hypothetical protein [Planctomycetota bacterium]